jgi:hypothetical protein
MRVAQRTLAAAMLLMGCDAAAALSKQPSERLRPADVRHARDLRVELKSFEWELACARLVVVDFVGEGVRVGRTAVRLHGEDPTRWRPPAPLDAELGRLLRRLAADPALLDLPKWNMGDRPAHLVMTLAVSADGREKRTTLNAMRWPVPDPVRELVDRLVELDPAPLRASGDGCLAALDARLDRGCAAVLRGER